MFKFFLEKKYKEWAGEWLQWKRPFVKPSTMAKYELDVQTRLLPKFGEYRLSAINEKAVQAYIIELSKEQNPHGRPLTITTIKGWIVELITSLNDAASQGLCQAPNFKLKYPKTAQRGKVEVFTKEEQKAILAAFKSEKGLDFWARSSKGKGKSCRELHLLGTILSLFTGMRIGEVCGVRWKDINFTEKTITVQQTIQRIYKKSGTVLAKGTPKSATSNRTIPISTPLLKILEAVKKGQALENYVLTGTTTPTEPRQVRIYFENMLKNYKITRRKFHALRHTFATRCIEAGIDPKTVSTVLGHASPMITLSIYCHPAENLRRKCVEVFADF